MSPESKIGTKAPYALSAGAGRRMGWFNSTITLKASCPDIGVTEVTLAPGEEPPLHVHQREDEWFLVQEGRVTFHVGDETFVGERGAFVSLPRGIPHTFSIESSSARFLVINTPGGFEHMFERNPQTPQQAVSAMEAFGMTMVGPHPRMAVGSGT